MTKGKSLLGLMSFLIFIVPGFGQGVFEGHTDVGRTSMSGSADYDAGEQTYIIRGSGANMWSSTDAFHLVWRRLCGDFILRTRARFTSEGIEPHRKMGWIIRTSLEGGAAYIDAVVHGDGLAAMQYRQTENGETGEIRFPVQAPDVVQLKRTGKEYTVSMAVSGDTLISRTITAIDLGDTVYAGLFVCAHNDTVMEEAAFKNVRIVVPAKSGFVPYRDFIGSNLEIMDISSGEREIVYHDEGSVQAPNWTSDEALIFNKEGKLYRFNLEKKIPELIDTGFATANNNDHVLSFDGKMIGISHHPESNGFKSIIYTLPVSGGIPGQITEEGPSYLHGWSPDGKYLVYTAERHGDFDIYKIPSGGGEEIRLTDAPGLDDGSEYAPDGAFVYFNSVRSGKMQIWRMKPDGSGQEQITDDNMNNWFPHVSPDGKWIAFLSYQSDVAPGEHPFYREVYIRLMPVNGHKARVIAYVYGGQGTINVPSWAPDSRHLAFVSCTGRYPEPCGR
jgi:TolB protein